jgi:hypothetical protein
VVAPDVTEALQLDKRKVLRVKDVIERISKPPVIGMERGIQTPSDARIEEARVLLKQARGVAPRHIVEISRNDGRLLEGGDLSRCAHQFGIAEARILLDIWARRPRVKDREP